MATPLTDTQLEHVRQTVGKMNTYLYKVRADLAEKGHDETHTLFCKIDEAWQTLVGLSDACTWVMRAGPGLGLEGGSLHTGPIPPQKADE